MATATSEFQLKWNDFQQNVSRTFSQLRQESGLFDVTLVSSDQKQVSAHRLVLSACSDFFKNIFCNNTHTHPLLYLDRVNSREINLMLDYIYNGEVNIHQIYLDRFLEIGEKFKLDGILAPKEVTLPRENSSDILDDSNKFKTEVDCELELSEQEDNIPTTNTNEKSITVMNQSLIDNYSKIESKFEELVVKENNSWKCTACGKISKKIFNIKRHIEIHLSGLSYECNVCGKDFKSSNYFNVHKYKSCKNIQ